MLLRVVTDLINVFITKRVSRSAAEFSYFLTLSVFPLLICLTTMLGNASISAESLVAMTSGIVPAETAEALTGYLEYVSSHNNTAMLTAGLLLMCTSSASAFRCIHNIMSDIQGGARYEGFFSLVVSFLFSLAFLASMYFAVTVVLTGDWFLAFINDTLKTVDISWAWRWVRFILLFCVLLVMIYGIYRLTSLQEVKGNLALGAALASFVLVVVSMIFSWFIGMSARYPLVYGSLAAVIILMVWLYVCGNILIMGNAFNIVWRKHKLRELRSANRKKKFRTNHES